MGWAGANSFQELLESLKLSKSLIQHSFKKKDFCHALLYFNFICAIKRCSGFTINSYGSGWMRTSLPECLNS
jgi:hypothetical protein